MKKLLCIAALAVAFVCGPAISMAGEAENRLPTEYYNNELFPKIDMTNINLKFREFPSFLGRNGLGVFSARSGKMSDFTLFGPDGASTSFDGFFSLKALMTNTGDLKGGFFTFWSRDEMFGKRRNVFSGRLESMGWSDSEGFLEFGTTDFSGWACDQGWCTERERLWFNTQSGDFGLFSSEASSWKEVADGTAVIPVPAAVWLFGSGLVGLIGVARRRKALSA